MKNTLDGFTLAEGLIAMAIVGIIAALTIPNIVANYQKQSFLTGIKKAYTDLQQNLTVLQTENYRKKYLSGTMFNLGYIPYYTEDIYLHPGATIENTTGRFLKTYYKYTRDCGTDTQPCFADAYGSIDSNDDESFNCSDGYSILTANGTAICMTPIKITEEPASKICRPDKPSPYCHLNKIIKDFVTVYIDINGSDPPNIGGRDMFTFKIYNDYSIDEVSPEFIKNATAETERNNLFNNNCKTSSTGEGCFGKILNDNWQMNY